MTGGKIPIANRRVMEIKISLDTTQMTLSSAELPDVRTSDVTPSARTSVGPPPGIRPRTTLEGWRKNPSLSAGTSVRKSTLIRGKSISENSIEEA